MLHNFYIINLQRKYHRCLHICHFINYRQNDLILHGCVKLKQCFFFFSNYSWSNMHEFAVFLHKSLFQKISESTGFYLQRNLLLQPTTFRSISGNPQIVLFEQKSYLIWGCGLWFQWKAIYMDMNIHRNKCTSVNLPDRYTFICLCLVDMHVQTDRYVFICLHACPYSV